MFKCFDCFKNPTWTRKLHTNAAILWIVFTPIALTSGLKDSVRWVNFLSLYAIVTGHLASGQGARAEEAVNNQSNNVEKETCGG